MRQREIDEKLEKLGIERRSDSALQSVHGRATSVRIVLFFRRSSVYRPVAPDLFPRRPCITTLQTQ